MRKTTAKFAELGLVALGGALGTLARYLLNELIGDVAELPFGVLAINLSGAFLLGALLEALALRGPDTGARRKSRLLLGTGVLGGYTTYSLLAVDIAVMLEHDRVFAGVAYGVATLMFGGLASWLGILSAKKLCGTGRADLNGSTTEATS